MNLSSISVDHETFLRIIIIVLTFIILIFVSRSVYKRLVIEDDRCPKCGGSSFHRIHRNLLDKFFSYGTDIRRFRCDNPECRWTGLRHIRHSSDQHYHETSVVHPSSEEKRSQNR